MKRSFAIDSQILDFPPHPMFQELLTISRLKFVSMAGAVHRAQCRVLTLTQRRLLIFQPFVLEPTNGELGKFRVTFIPLSKHSRLLELVQFKLG